jgi:phosphatidylinositol glycan class K
VPTFELTLPTRGQHHPDWDIGVAVIDSYTYYNLEFLENIDMSSTKTLKDLVSWNDGFEINVYHGPRPI